MGLPHQDSKNESVGVVKFKQSSVPLRAAQVSGLERDGRIFSEISAILHAQGLGIITEYLCMQIVSGWHALAISALVWEFTPNNSPALPPLCSLCAARAAFSRLQLSRGTDTWPADSGPLSNVCVSAGRTHGNRTHANGFHLLIPLWISVCCVLGSVSRHEHGLPLHPVLSHTHRQADWEQSDRLR